MTLLTKIKKDLILNPKVLPEQLAKPQQILFQFEVNSENDSDILYMNINNHYYISQVNNYEGLSHFIELKEKIINIPFLSIPLQIDISYHSEIKYEGLNFLCSFKHHLLAQVGTVYAGNDTCYFNAYLEEENLNLSYDIQKIHYEKSLLHTQVSNKNNYKTKKI